VALGEPAARAALQKWVELQTKLGVAPSAAEDNAEDPVSRFAAGRLAFLMDSRRVVPALRDAVNHKFEWDVVALPRHGAGSTILHSEAVCMAANAKDKAAAFSVIEALAGPDGQRTFAEIGRTVPSLRAVAESPSFLTPGEKPANSRVWLDNASRLRYAPVNASWPELETRINVELENAFYGRKSLDDALLAIDALQR
jgi:multiple sugar transport system substrate-binding protein